MRVGIVRLIVPLIVLGGVACYHALAHPPLWASTHVQPAQAALIGRVTSSRDRRPLPDAVIWLLGPAGQRVDSTRADLTGAFAFGPIAPGPYRLQVRMIAHRPLAIGRDLRADAIDTVEVRLAPDTTGIIADCLGRKQSNGTRGFGSQFCRPEGHHR